ncbi:MAG: polyprenyl synthetase family protein [Bacteroidales bacterium]|nr:polyprenyl synthetase family protein [Bacteroidales bacterium]
MLSYKESLGIIEKKLEEFSLSRQPSGLYEPIRYILSIGGKRIRPCLTLMSHSIFSDDPENAIAPALGLEVFHNFTLMHDDIMDNAEKRRNFETVHVKWNNNTAILSGDAMLIMAYQLIAKAHPPVLSEILNLYNQTALEVCEGQQYDMDFETRKQVSVEDYLEMIRLKTAVLLAASLSAGAILAEASRENSRLLYQVGQSLGIGFQLQDDYLDVFAEDEAFGKAIGNDILSNKKTYLMLSALQSGNTGLVKRLESWIAKKDFDPAEKIKSVQEIYRELNIGEKTLEISREYFNRGLQYLQQLAAPEGKKVELIEFARFLASRSF